MVFDCGHERTMNYLFINLSLHAAAGRADDALRAKSAQRRGWRRTGEEHHAPL